MTVFVCVDDGNGMRFHRRRQSRDRVLAEDAARMAEGHPLWMASESAPLFEGTSAVLATTEQPPPQADAFYFAETPPLAPYLSRVDCLIVYRWNRRYPADEWLDVVPAEHFTKKEVSEFVGFSHEKITKEVWIR